MQAAKAAARTKGSYYQAKHAKLIFQLGSRRKADVAIANRIARTIYHLIRDPNQRYRDLGSTRVEGVEQQIKRKIGQLKALGVNVTIQSDNTVAVHMPDIPA